MLFMALGGASDVRLTTPSSPTKMRRKVGGTPHLYRLLGRTAHDVHMAASNAIHVETPQSDGSDHCQLSFDGGRPLHTGGWTMPRTGRVKW
jgi:hypothetical protein